ncbi:hypothetical protein WA158_005858 [Blastocystis sp. Blastoise]
MCPNDGSNRRPYYIQESQISKHCHLLRVQLEDLLYNGPDIGRIAYEKLSVEISKFLSLSLYDIKKCSMTGFYEISCIKYIYTHYLIDEFNSSCIHILCKRCTSIYSITFYSIDVKTTNKEDATNINAQIFISETIDRHEEASYN